MAVKEASRSLRRATSTYKSCGKVARCDRKVLYHSPFAPHNLDRSEAFPYKSRTMLSVASRRKSKKGLAQW